jgi:hypothetical protein
VIGVSLLLLLLLLEPIFILFSFLSKSRFLFPSLHYCPFSSFFFSFSSSSILNEPKSPRAKTKTTTTAADRTRLNSNISPGLFLWCETDIMTRIFFPFNSKAH